jgi:hypothetical protein
MLAMRRRVESSAFSRVGRSSRVASTLASVLARRSDDRRPRGSVGPEGLDGDGDASYV